MSTETVPKGYKRSEVGVIPEEWEVKPLRSLIDPQRGIRYGIVQPGKYDRNGRFMIRGQDYSKGWVDPSEFFMVSEKVEEPFINARVRSGDVLITIVGASTGKIAIVPNWLDGANLTQTTARISIIENEMASAYCAYILSGQCGKDQVKNYIKGAAQPGLNCGDIEKFLIPCPQSVAEQQAIAAALSDADALIESLEQLLTKKRQIKQGAMQELLTGKRRLPGFTGKWTKSTLHDIASIQRGASPRPIDDPVWFDDKSEIGWVRISDVTQSGMYLRETTQKLSGEGVKRSRLVQSGNLIMSICATVGRPVITEITACIHDGFVVFDNLQVDKYFLYYFLISIIDDWSKHGQTGSQMNLNTGLINSTPIPIPPLPEQSAIASILSDMDAELEVLEGKLEKARQVKQGMMQQLLTGKVRLVSSQPKETEVPFLVAAESSTSKAHNQPFNEAVLISVLAGRYGNAQFPLTRFRYTKFLYLFHRHVDHVAQGFRKKAAGPYNPDNRYRGPETIAQKNGYMVRSGSGFVAGSKNTDALGYFEKWYPLDHLVWLDRFRFAKNDALEVLTTVDMACEDLRIQGKPISVQTVKTLIESEPEWLPKLEREIFSDTGIAAAIRQSQALFGGNSA